MSKNILTKSRRRALIILLAMAALLTLMTVGLSSCAKKAVPVYTGMTISGAANTTDNTLESEEAHTPTFADPGTDNGLHKGHYKGDCKDDEKEEPEDEPFDTPLSDSLEVTGGTQDRFYAKSNEDVLVTVHVDNPDRFEILSFTLNGEKYSSYMFEAGSDLENLILKVNVGEAEGLVEYTIDAIKYVDGEKIKDVQMDGERTVTLAVHTEKQPTSTITNESIGFNTVDFHVAMTDPMGLLVPEVSRLQAVVYDGTQIVATKDLPLTGEADVQFDGLKTNTLYQYAVLATYDALDGKGVSTYILSKKAFYTKAVVLFDGVELSTTGVSYTLDWDADAASKTPTAIEVLRGEERVATLDPGALAATGLRPNTAYVLVLSYQNGAQTESIRLEFTTDPLVYTVNHLLENLAGDGYDVIATSSTVVEQDAIFAPALNAYEGFTAPAAVQITANAASDSFAVDYKYTRNSYMLTLNNSGVASSQLMKYGAPLEAVSKPDFDFVGWFHANGTEIETMPADSAAVFATWAGEACADDLRFSITETDLKITVMGLKNEDLTELHIPSYLGGMPVVAIGMNAFRGEFRLTKVTVPNSVTSIGAGAFSGCSALQEITIPFVGERVKEATELNQYPFGYIFGEDAYQGGVATTQVCFTTSLQTSTTTDYYIPKLLTKVTVTSGNILPGAFINCADLTTILLPSGITEIGKYAFCGCSSLASITLPEGVAKIHPYAFSACSSLSSITLPTSLTLISSAAFEQCSSLQSITLPVGLQSIYNGAFANCALQSLHIPATVTTIDISAFAGSTALNQITVDSANTAFRMANNCLIDIVQKAVLCALPGATIPTDADVTSIRPNAFHKATWLTGITIPANITEIGSSAFSGCSSLEQVTFASNNTLTTIGSGAFKDCCKISTIIIPTSVTKIGSAVFANCRALTTLSIPFVGEKPVTENSTNQYPFGYIFGSLTSNAAVPNGFVKISQNYFSNNLTNSVYSYYFIPAGLTNVTVTGSTYLPHYAFHNCSFLQSITLPSTLQSVGKSALHGCSNLKTITIPAGVTSIGQNALYGCTALESMTIPFVGDRIKTATDEKQYPLGYLFGNYDHEKNQQVIQRYVYAVNSDNAVSTTSGTYRIPKSLTSVTVTGGNILQGAFYGCTMLTSVTLPQNITSIGDDAFYGCSGLTGIDLPTTLETIGSQSFRGCTALEELTLPASLTTIVSNTFVDCKKLSTVYYNVTAHADFSTSPFRGCGIEGEGIALIIGANVTSIPAALFANNATTLPLQLKSVSFATGSLCTSIGNNAFYGCSGLESINLPTALKTVGSYAFYDCTELAEISFPNGLTTIGDNAFYQCTSLEELTLPASLTQMTGTSFRGCAKLSTLYYNATQLTKEPGNSPFRSCGTEGDGLTVFVGANVTAIPAYLFYNANAEDPVTLKSITFATGSLCTSIGNNAFYGCSELERIDLPTTLETIGNDAFYGCSGLTGIDLPTTLETVGSQSFYGCAALTELTLPASLTTIASDAFFDCKKLSTIYYNVTAHADFSTSPFRSCGMEGEGVTLVIGANVTSIPAYLFANNSTTHPLRLKSVTFTTGSLCTSIGNTAFYGCTGLTSIDLPTTLQTIGNNAFRECVNLESIDLPTTLETIGGQAFRNCAKLKALVIPASVTSIGSGALSGCIALESLTIPFVGTSAKKATDKDQYPFGYIFGIAAVEGATAIKQTYISSGTTTTNNTYYIPSGLSSVTVTGGNILQGAFYGCTMLTSISLPQNLTSIGNTAFYGCTGLKSIDLPTMLEAIGTNTFRECVNLESIDLPTTLKTIGNQAFCNCAKLEALVIPASVTSIGSGALSGCIALESLTIPASVTSIGSGALSGCIALESLTIPFVGTSAKKATDTNQYPFGYIFGTTAVEGATAVNQFYITSGTTTTNTTYYIPSGLSSVTVTGGNILQGAFYGCKMLTSVSLPQTVTSIGNSAFYNCTGLTSVSLPQTVTSIGNMAFFGCRKLESFPLPSSLKTIGDTAFNGCIKPETLNLPQGVTSIGQKAFYNCEGLKTITLPESLQTIGSAAFNGCKYLTVINYNATGLSDFTSSNNPFFGAGDVTVGLTLNVGASVEKIPAYLFYENTALKSIAFAQNGVCSSISNYAFSGCWLLESICIPKTVSFIGTSAFQTCLGLESVTFEENSVCNDISGYAFAGCTKLQTVKFNKEMPGTNGLGLGKYVFSDCTALKDIVLPEKLRWIGNNSFENCTSLTAINIPASVTTLKYLAFTGCTGLTRIDYNMTAEPEAYASAGMSPFYKCGTAVTALALNIGEGVTTLPAYLFSNLTKLTVINYNAQNAAAVNAAFAGCGTASGGITLNIGAAVTTLSVGTLADIMNLKVITVDADNATFAVENGILYNKDKTQILFIPNGGVAGKFFFNSIAALEDGVSKYRAQIVEVIIGDGITQLPFDAFSNCVALERVTLPDTLVSIPYSSFSGCTNLQSINLPASLQHIGEWAFAYCEGLKELDIPSGVGTIAWGAFSGCTGLERITLPSVVSIESEAFYGCTKLTQITLPNQLQYIGHSTFAGCTKLESIVMPNSVTFVGEWAFADCAALKSVTLSNQLEFIHTGCFSDCTALKSIVIPESVTLIDWYTAFEEDLVAVYYCGTAKQWENISDGCYGTVYFYSATEPTTSGNYWHDADGDGIPNIWGQ